MLFELENIDGLYIIHDVLTFAENDFYMEKLQNEPKNICPQIHMANEYGWKFIPLRYDNGEIIKRTQDDYLGFPDWMNNLKNIVLEKVQEFFKEKKFNINHSLINKYEIGDGCHHHVDDLDFWTDFVIGVSLGSSTVMSFANNKSIINVNIPMCSVYIMLRDARYKWLHGIDFKNNDNVHGKITNRNVRISVTFREIKEEYLPMH